VAKRVILVDDSKTVVATAEMAVEELVRSGVLEFKTYLNPAELLQNLLGGVERYDLLISDINMPQMNGLDLAVAVKKDARFHSLPILILTTESSADMKSKGKEIGVTGWMVKPFSDEKLVKSIKMVLGI
jgi:two-component system chemotaxis response regulator CheY